MGARNFRQMLEARWAEGKLLCVGLDVDVVKIPEAIRQGGTRETIVAFNRAIVDVTKDLVCSYKPNVAFYEAWGEEGLAALRETIAYIIEISPEIPVILDAKRGDIITTNRQYAAAAFDHLRADAVTVNPYMGSEPLKPFFDHADKGVIVLTHTSNPGAREVQELEVEGEPLFLRIARNTVEHCNGNGNCCVMVGATYPEELSEVRTIVGDMPILIAGIGAQNGDLEKTIKNGIDSRKRGLMVNASRSIIFASPGADFAEAARAKATELHGAISAAL